MNIANINCLSQEVAVYSAYRPWLMSRFSLYARSIMSYRLIGLFFVCAILGCVNASSISCKNKVKYTCEGEKFYYPRTQGCLPYSNRCTNKLEWPWPTDASKCQETSYTGCDYTSGVFKAYRCSSGLFSSKKYKIEHQFITYRGLMYEFGCYGTRVQDPLDPKYEYRTNGGSKIKGCKKVASSATCTYEQIKQFSEPWTDERYKLLWRNCQDYARGLGKYINMDCSMPGGRKREETSDLDFAKFVFSLSGNCTLNTTQLNANSSSSSTVSLTMGMIIAIGIIAGLML